MHVPSKILALVAAVAATLAFLAFVPNAAAAGATVQNLNVSDIGDADATITWDKYAGAVKYRVAWVTSSSSAPGRCEPDCTVMTPSTPDNPTIGLAEAFDAAGVDVVDGQTYHVFVSAINSSGKTITGWQDPPGLTINLTGTPEVIPDVVQNVKVKDGTLSGDDATIEWDKTFTAKKYRIAWGTTSSSPGRCEPNCTVLDESDVDLDDPSVTLADAFDAVGARVTPGQTYYVFVSAINSSGKTITGWQDPPGLKVALTGDPAVIPDAVQNLAASGITQDDATLTWKPVPTAVKYRVAWVKTTSAPGSCEPDCTVITPSDLDHPSISLADAFSAAGRTVTPGQVYYLYVSAINASGSTITGWQTPPSLQVNLDGAPAGVPDTVQNLAASNITHDDATITWDPVPTAVKYRVNWSRYTPLPYACEPSCTVVTPDDLNAPSQSLAAALDAVNATVRGGDTYYVLVSAIDASGKTITGWQDTPLAIDLTGDPDPASGVLDEITQSGSRANATAHFTPAESGTSAELQMLRIETQDTDEVSADDATWVKVASGTQDSNGKVTFSISDPYYVQHSYRAVSDGTRSNEQEFAATTTPKNTGLSAVYVNTNEGHSIDTRSHYFQGEFSMTASDNSDKPDGLKCDAINSDHDPEDQSKFKGRGNYSWSFSKKSFTIKLADGEKVCGMPEGKKFALIANAYDKSLLRGAAAFTLGAKLTNMAWTPRFAPVDLYINGSYQGAYQIVQRIEFDKDKIDQKELKDEGQNPDPTSSHPNNQEPNITGGYLLEWDFRAGGDENVHAGSRGIVGIKSPEHEDGTEGISSQQKDYINDYLDETDHVLFGSNFGSDSSGWKKYIDMDSAVDYYIGQEIMKPVDGQMWASVYMYKARDSAPGAHDGKLFFGPMWDYDLSSGSSLRAGNVGSTSDWYLRDPTNRGAMQADETWFTRLNDDSDFRNAVKARWRQLEPSLYAVHSFLDHQKPIMAKSVAENFKKWSINEHISNTQVVKGSYSAEFSYVHGWLENRIKWMDGQLG